MEVPHRPEGLKVRPTGKMRERLVMNSPRPIGIIASTAVNPVAKGS